MIIFNILDRVAYNYQQSEFILGVCLTSVRIRIDNIFNLRNFNFSQIFSDLEWVFETKS